MGASIAPLEWFAQPGSWCSDSILPYYISQITPICSDLILVSCFDRLLRILDFLAIMSAIAIPYPDGQLLARNRQPRIETQLVCLAFRGRRHAATRCSRPA